jgi:hypothetical protein
MKKDCTTGCGSRGSKGGATGTNCKRKTSKTNAMQTPNENILEYIGELLIALDTGMNNTHVNAHRAELFGCKARGS